MSQKITFKVISIYQYAENYAAWDWDGQGECPKHWKMKGSHEEILFDGCTLDMIQEEEFIEWAKTLGASRAWHDDYTFADFCGIEIVTSNSLNWLDEQDALWHEDYEYLSLFSNEVKVLENDNDPVDRFDAMAEKLGYMEV